MAVTNSFKRKILRVSIQADLALIKFFMRRHMPSDDSVSLYEFTKDPNEASIFDENIELGVSKFHQDNLQTMFPFADVEFVSVLVQTETKVIVA